MSTAFLVGQRLTADLLNTNVTAFMPSTTVKTASTDRISTVTLADDPELAGIALSVGTWEIVFEALWTQASATPKIATQWGFTGTTTGTARRKCMGPAVAQVAAPPSVTDVNFSGNDVNSSATYGTSTSAQYSTFRESVDNFVVATAGNLSIQWAQSVSTASNVTLRVGSSVTVRKII